MIGTMGVRWQCAGTVVCCGEPPAVLEITVYALQAGGFWVLVHSTVVEPVYHRIILLLSFFVVVGVMALLLRLLTLTG